MSDDRHRSSTGRSGGSRPLRAEEKTRLAIPALPTAALALAITTVSTYVGEVTRSYTHQTAVIGPIIGSEGIMALWIPLIAGALVRQASYPDRRTASVPAGRRAPGCRRACAARVSRVVGGGGDRCGFLLRVLFRAYEPYRALYPDLVDEGAGRGAGTEHAGAGARRRNWPGPARRRAPAECGQVAAVRRRRTRPGRLHPRLRSVVGPAWDSPPAKLGRQRPGSDATAMEAARHQVRASRLPHRQRCLGDGPGSPQGVRDPVPHDRLGLQAPPCLCWWAGWRW